MDAPGLEFALIVFEHPEGAERAYARAPRSTEGAEWMQEVVFVEHDRRNRIVVSGTFAGRYVDADDEQEFMERKTAEGAVAGGAAGVSFGSLGLAVGFVGGGLAGGVAQERSNPQRRSAFFDEGRREVPEGSSALIRMAAPEHVDAMVSGLEGKDGRVIRHHLLAEEARALKDAVAGSPRRHLGRLERSTKIGVVI